jgi:NAD(P)H-dependent flavin oxidoreductase YrpB (nitropropane dioxygenase family)
MLLNDYMIRTMATQGGIDSYDDLPSSDDSGGTSESNRTVASFVNGDLENQSITTSQASGLIKDIPTCRELIERMMGDADGILARLNGLQQN